MKKRALCPLSGVHLTIKPFIIRNSENIIINFEIVIINFKNIIKK